MNKDDWHYDDEDKICENCSAYNELPCTMRPEGRCDELASDIASLEKFYEMNREPSLTVSGDNTCEKWHPSERFVDRQETQTGKECTITIGKHIFHGATFYHTRIEDEKEPLPSSNRDFVHLEQAVVYAADQKEMYEVDGYRVLIEWDVNRPIWAKI